MECFDCGTVNRAPLQATNTSCANCGTFIDMRDFNIRDRTTQRIRTRGNVTVHKKGALLGTVVHCGSLLVHGTVGGSIHAQNTVEFHTSTKVVGELRCRQLILNRRCQVQCLQPVHAAEAFIEGSFHGRLIATGQVSVGRHAILEGSVDAPVLVMEAGAQLNAAMHIHSHNPLGRDGDGDGAENYPQNPPEV